MTEDAAATLCHTDGFSTHDRNVFAHSCCCKEFGGEDSSLTADTTPVSYTHLDVYKRQEENPYDRTGEKCMKLRNVLIVVKDIEKSKNFYHDLSVSYTHLKLRKR